MRFTRGYFELPRLLPGPDNTHYRARMMNVPVDVLNSRSFRGGLAHLYKRFLRLHALIDFSTAALTRHRMASLYASIIRAKFQVIYLYPRTASVELVGDTDMFVKLKNIRQRYEALGVEDRERLLEDHLDTLLTSNYLHHSIEDFVSLYNMLLVDVSENNGKFISWMLARNVSVLENGSDLEFVRNNLVYGFVFNFDIKYYLRRNNSYGWKTLYNGTYPFSAGMKGAYNPTIIHSRKDLNSHVYIDSGYKAKTREDLLKEEQAFFNCRYQPIEALRRKQQQRALFQSVLGLKNNFQKLEGSLDKQDGFSALFKMLHSEVHANSDVNVLTNYVSYLQYDSTSKRKFMENTVMRKGGGRGKAHKMGNIECKMKDKTDGDLKDMVLFLEERTRHMDTMKYGLIRFTHNVLTSVYLKKKFILPYIRGEL